VSVLSHTIQSVVLHYAPLKVVPIKQRWCYMILEIRSMERGICPIAVL